MNRFRFSFEVFALESDEDEKRFVKRFHHLGFDRGLGLGPDKPCVCIHRGCIISSSLIVLLIGTACMMHSTVTSVRRTATLMLRGHDNESGRI